MPIDFSAPASRGSYAGRDADVSWREAVRSVLDPTGPDDDEIDRWTLRTGSLRS